MLTLHGLTAGYNGAAAVRDVSLHVDAGEIVALLGPNGAGKSTTLRATSGLVDILGGRVELDGVRVDGWSPHRLARGGLALVPEDRALLPALTVAENLRIAHRQALDALEWFPALVPLLKTRAGLLSGGEQQMLAIARSIAAKPNVLMLDELSLGLAPIVVKSLMSKLVTFARETHAAVLLVEQHVVQALTIADRGYLMGDGHITMHDRAEVLLASRDVVTASYLGAAEDDVGTAQVSHAP